MRSSELADRVEDTIVSATAPTRTEDVFAEFNGEWFGAVEHPISHAEAETIREARSRIMGVGKDQYEDSDTVQKFEKRTLSEIAGEVRAEIIDVINWAVMWDIMLQKRIEELKELGE